MRSYISTWFWRRVGDGKECRQTVACEEGASRMVLGFEDEGGRGLSLLFVMVGKLENELGR